MDINTFRALVNSPSRTKADLQQMLLNARKNPDEEFAAIAKEALDSRFPGWDVVRSKKGGSTPTTTSFRGLTSHFPTAKAAYIWLIERFAQSFPDLLSNIDWKTQFVVQGTQRQYFSRTPEEMFFNAPHLANDSNNYFRLVNGWYVNLNLSNELKFKILCRFSAVANLEHGREWLWQPDDKTEHEEDLGAFF